MGWYFYSGSVVRPIPVKNGLSISVRPQTKVEILEVTAEAQALIRKGQLRLTGKPKGQPGVTGIPVNATPIVDVVVRTTFASSIAEKGTTSGPKVSPVPFGEPEMTHGETEIARAEEKTEIPAEIPAEMPNVADDDSAAEGDEEIDQAANVSEDTNRVYRKRRR